MRSPHVTKLEQDLDALNGSITKAMNDLDLERSWARDTSQPSKISGSYDLSRELLSVQEKVLDAKLQVVRQSAISSSLKIEMMMGVPALIAAGRGTILLIASSIFYSSNLPLFWFFVIILFGFGPAMLLLITNLALLGAITAQRKTFSSLFREYHTSAAADVLLNHLLHIAQIRVERNRTR
jgi:hypothetical protein